ncbi:uncharacterized protein BYT42DRAFT_586799 [Radiomyces spectabilis]|uniref:uncharacterized protein n=1 Tax=Radiomyces spectabilis TaxID=64574 RepID=UPI0022210F43|nr:uncharacterized protein BYT42DRAFT_586799 [Radiomyces spectabilis]KAI8367585.1 hypothetical protein BYT42DRAFT_586799 [Radiomyces spectabilis]
MESSQTIHSNMAKKSKWQYFKTWFKPEFASATGGQRRPSHSSSCYSTETNDHPDPDLAAEKCLFLPFRRRASSASEMSVIDFQKETEKLYELYAYAVDELNYAEDSHGSPYYSGDRVTAQEAIDGCTDAFMQLLQQTSDINLRTHLQSSITPRLIQLQEKYNALPMDVEPLY